MKIKIYYRKISIFLLKNHESLCITSTFRDSPLLDYASSQHESFPPNAAEVDDKTFLLPIHSRADMIII